MTDVIVFKVVVSQAWQIAILSVIVCVAVRLFAPRRPRAAHLLLLIVTLKCVTPPLWGHSWALFSQLHDPVSWIAATDEASASNGIIRSEVNLDGTFAFATEYLTQADFAYSLGESGELLEGEHQFSTAEDTRPTVQRRIALLARWCAAICWTLLAGMIGSVVLLAFQFVRCLRRIQAHRVTEFDEEIGALVAALARQLKLRRVPRVMVSDVRFGPAVLGMFRHVVVLPRCLVADSRCRDPQVLRPILAHELLHIRRGDLWIGTLQAVVQCVWWFHPAVWIVNRLLSRETERCCDEQVVAELNCPPVEYARSLLSVIECKQSLQPVPVFPGMKPVEITSQRMERIMSLTQGSRTRMSWWSLIAALLFAAVVLPGAVVGQQAVKSMAAEVVDSDVEAAQSPESAKGKDMHVSEAVDEVANAPAPIESVGYSPANEHGPTTSEQSHATEKPMVGKAVYSDAGVTGSVVFDGFLEITVLGAVKKPGKLRLSSDERVTFLSAIAAAGGFTDFVDDSVVLRRKLRSGGTSVTLLSINKPNSEGGIDPTLRDGDVLVVEVRDPPSPLSIAEQMRVSLATPVSISIEDEPVTEVLSQLAAKGRFGIQWKTVSNSADDSKLNERVSLKIDNEPLLLAFDGLCRELGLEYEVQHQVMQIRQRKPHEAREVIEFRQSRPYEARVYNVADLVVPVAETVPAGADAQTTEADFTGLIELIRTTVEPQSWNGYAGRLVGGRIQEDENTLSLVIRQTSEVHDQIVDLLGQLRALQNVKITTSVRVLQFNTPEQLRLLNDNVNFHDRAGHYPWALLPVGAAGDNAPLLEEVGVQVKSAPKITTFVGQEANLDVPLISGHRLQLTAAVPKADDKLLQFSYAASRSSDRQLLRKRLVTQMIGNGQTLLLDLTVAAKPQRGFRPSGLSAEEPAAAERNEAGQDKLQAAIDGRTILAITPTIMPAKKEEQLIFGQP